MTGDCTLTEHSAAHKSPQLPARAQAMQYSLCAMENPTSKMWEPGGSSQISSNPHPFFPECIRNNISWMSKVLQAGLTDLENQMEQTEFAAGHLINIKIAIDSLLLKEKAQMKERKLK